MRVQPVYIDPVEAPVYGDEALRKVAAKTDTAFLSERGIVSVSPQRWHEAQQFEKNEWIDRGKWRMDDRNFYHQQMFGGYETLHGLSFDSALEIGCGPFTNMRLLAEVAHVRHVHLLDPLVQEYLQHRYCRYTESVLKVDEPLVRFVRRLHKRLPILKRRIPATLHACSMEEYSTGSHDLVVMINVMEHVQDLTAVFDNIRRILRPGGYFVFADKYYDSEVVESLVTNVYDAGHPIKADRAYIDSFMDEFTSLFYRTEHQVATKPNTSWPEHDEFYFIGTRI